MEKYPGPVNDSPFVDWNPDPVIFTIPGTDHPIVWYGALFAIAFIGSFYLMNKVYKTEGRTSKDLDTLTLYVVLGTVIGARLGHCLFYEPEIYLRDPIRILKIWEGGLASHGGAIGIFIALWLYVRKTKENFWWILDRLMIAVAFSATCIRIGNLMNSEIVGKVTDLPGAFRFIQHDLYEKGAEFRLLETEEERLNFIENIPARHPSQLYEAVFCFILLLVYYLLWKKKKYSWPAGFMFGSFIATLFTFRFLVEFTKEVQVEFEKGLSIDMGQYLSIPFVLAGIFIMYWSKKHNKPHKLKSNA